MNAILQRTICTTTYLPYTSNLIKEETTFHNMKKSTASEPKVTAEIIYYWMICHGIPFECQKWHLNRLLTLINVCNAKSQKPQKIPRAEQIAYNKRLNAANKRRWNTRG